MKAFVFDIETVGERFDEMDSTTQSVITKWIREESKTEEDYQRELQKLKERLPFSPLHGEIVSIAVLDIDTQKGAVYYQDPGKEATVEGEIKYEPMSEDDMLAKFWELMKRAECVVGYNSRSFDVPYLNIRSAIHKIRPSVDLMEGRYLYQQRKVRHIDLQDQLCYYGALQKKGGLHLWTRAFGIDSPKSDGVSGDQVGKMYEEGKRLEIAKYNYLDVVATRELYLRWRDYLNFQNY